MRSTATALFIAGLAVGCIDSPPPRAEVAGLVPGSCPESLAIPDDCEWCRIGGGPDVSAVRVVGDEVAVIVGLSSDETVLGSWGAADWRPLVTAVDGYEDVEGSVDDLWLAKRELVGEVWSGTQFAQFSDGTWVSATLGQPGRGDLNTPRRLLLQADDLWLFAPDGRYRWVDRWERYIGSPSDAAVWLGDPYTLMNTRCEGPDDHCYPSLPTVEKWNGVGWYGTAPLPRAVQPAQGLSVIGAHLWVWGPNAAARLTDDGWVEMRLPGRGLVGLNQRQIWTIADDHLVQYDGENWEVLAPGFRHLNLEEVHDGAIWLASESGVGCYDGKLTKQVSQPIDRMVSLDRPIAVAGDRVIEWEADQWNEIENLGSVASFADIAVRSRDDAWAIGTDEQLYRGDMAGWQVATLDVGRDVLLDRVFVTPSGEVWVSTTINGVIDGVISELHHWDGHDWTHPSILLNGVLTGVVEHAGVTWFSVYDTFIGAHLQLAEAPPQALAGVPRRVIGDTLWAASSNTIYGLRGWEIVGRFNSRSEILDVGGWIGPDEVWALTTEGVHRVSNTSVVNEFPHGEVLVPWPGGSPWVLHDRHMYAKFNSGE